MSEKWKRPNKKTLLKTKTKMDLIKEIVEPEDYEEAYFNSIGW